MDLRNVDLNLLMPLHALLEERSVSRAAERMRMSQPALSASLARIRRLFNDEILVRRGNSYELSPLAVQLQKHTWTAVSTLDRLFSAPMGFDPSTSTREFRVRGTDYTIAVCGPAISRALSEIAPHVTLRFDYLDRDIVDQAPDSLRECDGAIIPHGFISSELALDLFEDEWVILSDASNDAARALSSADDLGSLPWVFTMNDASAFTPAARQLRMIGIEPRVEVVTPGFMSLPELIRGTDRIALIQRRLAKLLATDDGLAIAECPFDVVPLKEAFWWNELHEHDPEHRWFRQVIAQAGASIATQTS